MIVTQPHAITEQPFVVAQITDSHLFASLDGLHCGHNVFKNLSKVLLNIANSIVHSSSTQNLTKIDCIVFTGDLTQDHTEQAYQNFVDCVYDCKINIPIYYLAGNHDEPELFAKFFKERPFKADKEITLPHWQIQLVDSKSDTPAGYVSQQALGKLKNTIKQGKYQLLMMHHHPIDVGYFIDKHGLQNKLEFWQVIHSFDNIKAIACGHVHGAMELTLSPINSLKNIIETAQIRKSTDQVTVYTCPATSIQFDPAVKGVGALDKGPGYRIFKLFSDGSLHSDVIYV